MVKIERLELTDKIARYRYFPEDSRKCGIVALDRETGERKLETMLEGYGSNYAAHALRRIEEYQKKGEFLKKDVVAWY